MEENEKIEVGYFDSHVYGVVFDMCEIYDDGEKIGDFAALIKVSVSKSSSIITGDSYSIGISPCIYNYTKDKTKDNAMWVKSSINSMESLRTMFRWENTTSHGSIEYYNVFPNLNGDYIANIRFWDDSTATPFRDENGNKIEFNVELNLKDINRQTSTSDFIWIPKQAELITASNFSDNDSPVITYSRIADDSKYIQGIKAIISINGDTDDIIREIPANSIDNTYTFNLTANERQRIISSVASGTTRQITYKLLSEATQYYYDTYGTTELVKTFTIADAYPTATIAVEDADTTTLALTGNKNKFIKYYSDLKYELNSTATKYANIIAEEVRNGSKYSNTESGILQDIESNIVEFSAIDSRNNGVYGSITLDMVDYIKLTCNQKIELELSDETEAAGTLTISGNYYKGSFGAASNTLTIQTRQTDGNGNWGEWVNLTDFVEVEYDDGEYELTVGISGLSYAKPYKFQSRAIDKLATATTDEYSSRVMPVFDWSENDFQFNVPVAFNDDVEFMGAFEFSGDFVIDGDTLSDYVIESGNASMGSNGTWYWRKWKSGKAECYGCRNYGNMAVSTAWGGLYRSEAFNQALPSGLFTDIPEVIEISYRGSNYGGWICRHETTAASKTNTGGFIVVRPASATISQVPISFNIIGRWK